MSRPKPPTRSVLRRAECDRRISAIRAFVDRLSAADLGSTHRCWIAERLNSAEMMIATMGRSQTAERFIAEVVDVLRPFWPYLMPHLRDYKLDP